MKSKLLLAMTSLLLVGGLAACGGSQDSSTSSGSQETSSGDYSSESTSSEGTSSEGTSSEDSSSEDSSDSHEESPWSEDELDLFDAYLYGVTVPHPGVSGLLSYIEDDGALLFVSDDDTYTSDLLDSYAASFEEAGWTDASGDTKLFTLEVETEEGTRYVTANFAIVDDEGNIASTGSLMAYFYDPFYYEWPAELVDLLTSYLGSESTVPAFEADRYQLDTDWLIFGQAAIYCFTEDTESTNAYLAIVKEAGWTVSDEPDETGYYKAIAPTEDLQIEFGYDEDWGDLDIYIYYYEKPITEWPTEDVAILIDSLFPGNETVIPALDGADTYDFYGDNEIDCYTEDTDLLDAYLAILTEAGWKNTKGNDYLSPDGTFVMTVYYDDFYECITIVFNEYVEPITEWPTDAAADIVTALAGDTTTVVPALDGATEYVIDNNAEAAAADGYGKIIAYCEDELAEGYAEILTKAGYTKTAEGYVSANEDILVWTYYDADLEQFEIVIYSYVKPSIEWPAQGIVELLDENVTDVIPAYEGEGATYRILNDDYGTAIQVLVEEGTEEAALQSYVNTLIDAGYTLTHEETTSFTSPNEQIRLNLYLGTSGSFTIEFDEELFFYAESEFQLDLVNTFLTVFDLGFNLTDGLPDAEGKGYVAQQGTAGAYAYIAVTVKGNQLSSWNEALYPILNNAGYTLNDDYSSESSFIYNNAAYHEVQINYDGEEDITTVVFYE